MLKGRKIKIAVLSALLVSLFIAFIFYLTLSVGEGKIMPLSNSDWLNFWGSYAGSVLALVVGLIARFYRNANCEQTLLQQNKILNYQQTIKEQEERNECLKNNLNLLNYAEIQGITASINQNDLTSSKEKIVSKKADIYICVICNFGIFTVMTLMSLDQNMSRNISYVGINVLQSCLFFWINKWNWYAYRSKSIRFKYEKW